MAWPAQTSAKASSYSEDCAQQGLACFLCSAPSGFLDSLIQHSGSFHAVSSVLTAACTWRNPARASVTHEAPFRKTFADLLGDPVPPSWAPASALVFYTALNIH